METEIASARDLSAAWNGRLAAFALPEWEELPALPLYMDQVIYLLNGYLAPLPGDGDDRAVTPAMINNYVKAGMMPRPVKKRYGRTHLALLLMICLLKPTLSAVQIKKLLPADPSEEEAQALYADFAGLFRGCQSSLREDVEKAAGIEEADGSASRAVFRLAVLSGLTRGLAGQIIGALPNEGEK